MHVVTTRPSIYDITVVGHVTRDAIVRDGSTSYRTGGVPYYSGIAASVLGANVRIITRVARQDEALLDEIRSAGVAVTNFESDVTTQFVNEYGDDKDLRRQRVSTIADSILPHHISGHSRLWYFGPLVPDDIAPQCMDHSLMGSAIVALDVQGLARDISGQFVKTRWSETAFQNVHLANIVKFSEEELATAVGNWDDSLLLTSPWTQSREVLVTAGSRGSSLYVAGTCRHVAAVVPGRIVDTTGCGDTYFAAYLWRRLCGDPPYRAVSFAAAASALKAENAGALDADFTAVRQFARLTETTDIGGGKERL